MAEPPEERHVLARGRDFGELPGKVLGHGRLVGGRVQQDHAHAASHWKEEDIYREIFSAH